MFAHKSTVTVAEESSETEDEGAFALTEMQSFSFDMEDSKNLMNEITRNNEKSSGGKWSAKMTDKNEYGIGLEKTFSDLKSFNTIREVGVTLKTFSSNKIEGASFVFTIDDAEGKNIFWKSFPLTFEAGKWNEQQFDFAFSKNKVDPTNRIKMYVWNQQKQTFFVDDLSFSFKGIVKTNVVNIELPAQKVSSFTLDFESDAPSASITNKEHYSGKQAFHMTKDIEYGPSVTKKIKDVWDDSLNCVQMSAWIKCDEDNPEIVIVANTKDVDGDKLEWIGKSTKDDGWKKGEWKKINARFNLNEKKRPINNDEVTAYVWNKGKHDFFVDDVNITFGGEKKRLQTGIAYDATNLAPVAFEKNKFPLPLRYLIQTKINSSDSNENILPQIIMPGDKVFTGCFTRNNKAYDEIVKITGNEILLFAFCNTEYKLTGKVSLNNSTSNKVMLAGNFIANDYQQILIIDTIKNGYQIIDLSSNTVSCINTFLSNVAINLIPFSGETKLVNSVLQTVKSNNNINIVACINKTTGVYQLISFNKNSASIIESAKLNIETKDIVSLNSIPIVTNNMTNSFVINCKYKNGGQKNYLTAINSSGKLNCSFISNSVISKFINPQSYFIANDNSNSFAFFSSTFRNDFKVAEINNNTFDLTHQIEFKGYSINQNPKYYECVKMWPLKISGLTDTYLISMANCSKWNSTNTHCNQYENINNMPNQTLIFQFVK
nr:hypothetical protein [Bacteroidota bacterium]